MGYTRIIDRKKETLIQYDTTQGQKNSCHFLCVIYHGAVVVLRFLFTFALVFSSQMLAKDLVPHLFENTIATFTDASEMLYRSFNLMEMSRKKKISDQFKVKSAKQNIQVSPEEIQSFLTSKGIDASILSQPVAKEEFAQLLFQRFKGLPKSFLTQSLQFKKLYFHDAQSLKIFSSVDLAKETLTLKDMFASFLRAAKLADSFFNHR